MAKKIISKEIDFVQRAKEIVFESNRDSLASVKVGDTLVIDDLYGIEHGDWLELRSGDEFRVTFVDTHNTLTKPIFFVVMTKASSDGGSLPRYKVGEELDFGECMNVYAHLHRKNDRTLATRLRKLCQDYLDGLM